MAQSQVDAIGELYTLMGQLAARAKYDIEELRKRLLVEMEKRAEAERSLRALTESAARSEEEHRPVFEFVSAIEDVMHDYNQQRVLSSDAKFVTQSSAFFQRIVRTYNDFKLRSGS